MNTFLQLPEELISHILSFTAPDDLLRYRQVCQQFNRITRDQQLIKTFPAVYISNHWYLKEEAYRRPKLLKTILTTNDQSDLEWLVQRQAKILESLDINIVTWCLSLSAHDAARSAAWDVARGAAGDGVWRDARDAAWRAACRAAWSAARSAVLSAARCATWDAPWAAACAAACGAARSAFNNDSIYTDMINQILQESKDPAWIGQKSYQIHETLSLFLLKASFYIKLKELSLPGLHNPHIAMPDDNQWTLQYNTLFGSEN